MKLQFSLRVMLILTAAVAAFCWQREQPRKVAKRFVQAVESRQFAEADGLFVDPRHRFAKQFMEDSRNQIAVTRSKQTFLEWLLGRCRVLVHLEDYRGLGASISTHMIATSRGLHASAAIESKDGLEYSPAPRTSFRLDEQYTPHIKLDERPDEN
jgi:hypothetical protein